MALTNEDIQVLKGILQGQLGALSARLAKLESAPKAAKTHSAKVGKVTKKSIAEGGEPLVIDGFPRKEGRPPYGNLGFANFGEKGVCYGLVHGPKLSQADSALYLRQHFPKRCAAEVLNKTPDGIALAAWEAKVGKAGKRSEAAGKATASPRSEPLKS